MSARPHRLDPVREAVERIVRDARSGQGGRVDAWNLIAYYVGDGSNEGLRRARRATKRAGGSLPTTFKEDQ